MAATGTEHRQAVSYDRELDNLFDQRMQPADRMLTIIDFRGGDEATILEDARRTYRSR